MGGRTTTSAEWEIEPPLLLKLLFSKIRIQCQSWNLSHTVWSYRFHLAFITHTKQNNDRMGRKEYRDLPLGLLQSVLPHCFYRSRHVTLTSLFGISRSTAPVTLTSLSSACPTTLLQSQSSRHIDIFLQHVSPQCFCHSRHVTLTSFFSLIMLIWLTSLTKTCMLRLNPWPTQTETMNSVLDTFFIFSQTKYTVPPGHEQIFSWRLNTAHHPLH